MARLTDANVEIAREIIGRYPLPKSALIPLLHLAQEQDGWVTDDAMEHIAELVGVTPAEVLGTCSFYEMFKREPVGKYLVNVCTNISCQLLGGEELLDHAEETLGVKAGGTTDDGLFTLEDVECIAACTEAPCLQVNYRYRHRITHDEFDRLVADLRAGRLDATRSRPTARSPGSASTSPASGPPARRCPPAASEPAWIASRPAPPPPRRTAADDGTTPEDRHVAASATTTRTPSPATSRPAATPGLRARPRAAARRGRRAR